MKRVLIAGAVVFASVVGCQRSVDHAVVGDGQLATETRAVAGVREIVLHGAGTLEVKIAAPGPLELSGDRNLLPLISTTVENGKLTIRPTRSIRPRSKLTFRLSVANLESLQIDGAARFRIAPLDNDKLQIVLNGAAVGIVTGQTNMLDATLAGAAELDAAALVAKAVRIEIHGASNANVRAEETLDVSISGVGKVRYSGDPKVTKHVQGLGVVEKAD